MSSMIVPRARVAHRRLPLIMWKAAAAVALLVAIASPRAVAQPCGSSAGPRILVLRGVFEIFSLGMNDLACKLRSRGYDATSTSWALALFEADCCDDRPLVVIGHSLGGRMCGWASRKFMSCGRRVPLIVVVDANLINPIPPNVDRCLNLYVTNNFGIFHGSPVEAESPNTNLTNWDVSADQPSMFLGGVNHFDIDSTDWVHDIIIREIECMFPLQSATSCGIAEGASAMRRLKASCSPNWESKFASTSDADIDMDFANATHEPMSHGTRRDSEVISHGTQRGDKRIAWQPTRPSRTAADYDPFEREGMLSDRRAQPFSSVEHVSHDETIGGHDQGAATAHASEQQAVMNAGRPSSSKPSHRTERIPWQPTRPSHATRDSSP